MGRAGRSPAVGSVGWVDPTLQSSGLLRLGLDRGETGDQHQRCEVTIGVTHFYATIVPAARCCQGISDGLFEIAGCTVLAGRAVRCGKDTEVRD